MTDDPSPYIAMKEAGASVQEVYRKGRADGCERSKCLLLIMGVFDLELAAARDIGHEIYRQEQAGLDQL